MFRLLPFTSLSPSLVAGLLSTLILCGNTGLCQAENVKIPVGSQKPQQKQTSKPWQGMSKQQVQERYGKPQNWTDAVGKPPISSWEYPEFTVYFEYGTVVHSVLKHHPVKEEVGQATPKQ